MKKRIVVVVAITVLFTACNKIKQLININVEIPFSQQVSVPQIADTNVMLPPTGLSVMFPVQAIATNSQAYIDSYQTSPDKILRINLNTLSLRIASGVSKNFNYLDSVQMYVSGKTLPRQLIAYNYTISNGSDSLILDTVSNTNLKQYFLQDTMYIQLVGHFTAVPPGNTVLNTNSVFHLLANPLE